MKLYTIDYVGDIRIVQKSSLDRTNGVAHMYMKYTLMSVLLLCLTLIYRFSAYRHRPRASSDLYAWQIKRRDLIQGIVI